MPPLDIPLLGYEVDPYFELVLFDHIISVRLYYPLMHKKDHVVRGGGISLNPARALFNSSFVHRALRLIRILYTNNSLIIYIKSLS